MSTIRISSTQQVAEEDKALLAQLLPTEAQVSYEVGHRMMARERFYHGGGAGFGESILAPLIVTFAGLSGAAALIVLKSFLSAVGSELGKSFVKRWSDSQEAKDLNSAIAPVVAVYEVSSTVVTVVKLDQNITGANDPDQLVEQISKIQNALPEGEEAVLWASFNESSGLWTVERRKRDLSGIVYLSQDGPKLIRS
jgi:hypothetical protein